MVYGDLTDAAAVERILGEINGALRPGRHPGQQRRRRHRRRRHDAPTGGKPDPNDAVFIPMEDVRAVIDRNLLSCILTCKAVVPGMMERKRGWIVNFGSIGGLSGRADRGDLRHGEGGRPRVHPLPGGAASAVQHPGQLHRSRRHRHAALPGDSPGGTGAPGGDRHAGALRRPDRDGAGGGVPGLGSGPFISGQIMRVDGGTQLWPA